MLNSTPAPLARPKPPLPKSARKKRAAPPKRRRGGQPGNSNARKLGAFSVHRPGPLSAVRLRVSGLVQSYAVGALSPDKIREQSASLRKQIGSDISLTACNLQIKISRLVNHVTSLSIPFILRQRALETIARDPFGYFERNYKDQGIGRDADSFFSVSKLSARNSPDSPPQMSSSIWGGAGGGVPPDHPNYATNLTDEQWAVLAPLIPPDPVMDWLTGEPPVIIAASRSGFTRYLSTGEFNDFVIMQNYRQVLQRFPALLKCPSQPASPSKKRGRPRNRLSPRALLDAIIWKLATGHTWDALPLDFPPMRTCRKYYHRLFLSGRLYTLFLALYNHMRLEGETDPELLLEEGIFTTTPSQNIALSPGVPPTWQNYAALLFMQLAREAYSHFEREKKLANPFHFLIPVFKGSASLSTGRLPAPPSTPIFQPLDESFLGKGMRKIERDQKTIDRVVAKRIKAQKEAYKSSFKPASLAMQNRTDVEDETEQ